MNAMPDDKPAAALRRRMEALGPWFHNMELDGIATAPEHFLGDYPRFKWRTFAHFVPADLSGWRVLDIGCNGGFYSLEMKRRGAERVIGIDADPRYLAQARLAGEVLRLAVEWRQMSVYELADLRERFDLVLFMGVLYHLRHPLLALDLIREHVADKHLICQSLLRGSDDVTPSQADYPFQETALFADDAAPRLHFIEHSLAGDPTNWWVPNRACMEAMLRSAGFAIQAPPAGDVYLCRTA
ncbi:TIGR04290 family methyltransferase [Bosea sp. RCC_152_1]|uniref:TIGR04290 family methyltransferase n=1 Tax=Bosea sp. RCC_152_1 TaxID=3239228 RepID=UPI0035242B74